MPLLQDLLHIFKASREHLVLLPVKIKSGKHAGKTVNRWVRPEDMPKAKRSKKVDTKKKRKKKNVFNEEQYYTKHAKVLDAIKKKFGIGRSEKIRENVKKDYTDAIKAGLKFDANKFHEAYMEYFKNKQKWDKKFSSARTFDPSAFRVAPMKPVFDTVGRIKNKKKPKPYDKRMIRYLFEKYGVNSNKELIPGQPLNLNSNTRYMDYLVGDKTISVARKDLNQLPTKNYLSGAMQKTLLPHQQDASNLAMEKFDNGEKSFLIADGTGCGKTVEALAIANSYLNTINPDKPVIICTESDNIINTAWANDAKMLGLEINNAKINGFIPGKINITTYSQASKIADFDNLGLVIFDEAHNMKNEDSEAAKNCKAAMSKADHVLNATATPIDKTEHIHYITESLGLDTDRVIKEISNNDPIQEALNLTSFFNDLTRKGLMVKREVPLSNLDIELKNIKPDPKHAMQMQSMIDRYKAEGNDKNIMALRRAMETFKIDATIDYVQNELKSGRQVVLFADRVGSSTVYDFESKGTLPELERRLKELGIQHESLYGGSPSEKAKQENAAKVDRFQKGEAKVILGNPDSMGTGISLDDQDGSKPRTLVVMSAPFSAMDAIQVLGRVNRLKTKSRAKASFMHFDNPIDDWNIGILKDKFQTLGASVLGDYAGIDLDGKGIPTKGKTKEPPPMDINNYRKSNISQPEASMPEITETAKTRLLDTITKSKLYNIVKARTRKYTHKIATGNVKRPWKYFYSTREYTEYLTKQKATKEKVKKVKEQKSKPAIKQATPGVIESTPIDKVGKKNDTITGVVRGTKKKPKVPVSVKMQGRENILLANGDGEKRGAGESDIAATIESSELSGVGSPRESKLGNVKGAITKLSVKKQNALNKQIKELLNSKRPEEMTEDDKNLLSQYEGSGGQATNDEHTDTGKGILYEYYTPQRIIDKVWSIIQGYIPLGSSVLEPSAGIGRWAEGKSTSYEFDMLEIDETSSKIAQILHPQAHVESTPFEKMFLDKNNRSMKTYKGKTYKAVIGNPPYGKMSGTYKSTEGKGWNRYEEYFIHRSLDACEEGGIVAMVVPSTFLDKGTNDKAKQKILAKGELIDAYRLPEGSFSHTQIGTDVIILRKNTTEYKDNKLAYSGNFFIENPDKVFGERLTRKNRFGKEEIYTKGNVEDFVKSPSHPPKPMSEEHKNAISEALKGNKNAIGEHSVKEKIKVKTNTNKATVKLATARQKIANNIENHSPKEVYTQNEFNSKYQKNFDVIDIAIAKATSATGEITNFTKIPLMPGKTCYHNGSWYPAYIYASGDIRDKIADLEANKEEILAMDNGEEFYKKQLEMLKNSMPKPIKVRNISISPLENFARSHIVQSLEDRELITNRMNEINKILGEPRFSELKLMKYPKRSSRNKQQAKFNLVSYEIDGKTYTIRTTHDKLFEDHYGKYEIFQSNGEDANQVKHSRDIGNANRYWSSSIDVKFSTLEQAQDFLARAKADGTDLRNTVSTDRVREVETFWAKDDDKPKQKNLISSFIEYLNKLDSGAFSGAASKGDVLDYINRVPIRKGKDEEEESVISRKKTRKAYAEKLFQKYIQESLSDSEQANLEKDWNEIFNVFTDVDPTKIPTPIEGLAKTFKGNPLELKKVQYEGVSKNLAKGVSCNAYQVGVGKTITGIMTAVSSMQLGRCKKPVIVVPTSVLQKWEYEFKELYPNIPLNVVGTPDLNRMVSNGQKFEVNDGSVTLLSYDSFARFGFSDNKFSELTEDIKDQIKNPDKESEREKAKEDEDAEALAGFALVGTENGLKFDEAGFDYMCVDEAHNFNKIFMDIDADKKESADGETGKRESNEYVGLTGGTPSQRGIKFWLAARHILKENNNKNINLLTATPFTNNPLEAYSLLTVVAKERLEKMGINNVRDFIDTFVDASYEWVMEANGKIKNRQTVRGFKNAHVFQKLISEYFEYKSGEEAGINRPDLKRKLVSLPPTAEQIEMRDKYEALFDMQGKRGFEGAALKSMSNQQLLNLSPAIVKEMNPGGEGRNFVERSPKLMFALDSIAETIKACKKAKPGEQVPGQIVFLPRGVEYMDKMKDYLVKKHGIDPNSIACLRPKEKGQLAKDKAKAEQGISRFTELIQDFNNINGTVKVVIGSDVIKEGVDLNGNTAVAYNLMTSWNPTDEIQKAGRHWRQGNNQKEVFHVDVVIEDSMDTKLFQKQAEKGSRINDIFKNTGVDVIDVSDVNPDEIKVDIIKDPARRARMAVALERQKYENESRDIKSRMFSIQGFLEEQDYLDKQIKTVEENIADATKEIAKLKSTLTKEELAEDSDYTYNKTWLSRQNALKKQQEKQLISIKEKLGRFGFKSATEAELHVKELADKYEKVIDTIRNLNTDKLQALTEKFTKENAEKAKRKPRSLDSITKEHVSEVLKTILAA